MHIISKTRRSNLRATNYTRPSFVVCSDALIPPFLSRRGAATCSSAIEPNATSDPPSRTTTRSREPSTACSPSDRAAIPNSTSASGETVHKVDGLSLVSGTWDGALQPERGGADDEESYFARNARALPESIISRPVYERQSGRVEGSNHQVLTDSPPPPSQSDPLAYFLQVFDGVVAAGEGNKENQQPIEPKVDQQQIEPAGEVGSIGRAEVGEGVQCVQVHIDSMSVTGAGSDGAAPPSHCNAYSARRQNAMAVSCVQHRNNQQGLCAHPCSALHCIPTSTLHSMASPVT